MTLKSFIIPTIFATALAMSAAPASAQHGGGHMGGSHSGGGHMGGGGHSGGDHTGGGRPSVGEHGGFHGGNHGPDGQFRGHDRDGRFNGHDRFDRGQGFDHRFGHVRVIRPFHGPFFGFRPRFDLGFGLFLGWPVPYPWDYVAIDPYDYPYFDNPVDGTGTQSYEQYNQGGLTQQRNFGGVSLDITPADATITVDGTDAGTAETYSPSSAPLTLTPGQHHIVIAKPGYQTMTFDADVVQGQVLPYKGTMQPE